MISYSYKKFGVGIKHIWFAQKLYTEKDDSDIEFYHYLPIDTVCKDQKNLIIRHCNTIISDLSVGIDKLNNCIKKTYRYEIRRCDRDEENVRYEIFDDDNPLSGLLFDDFESVYNQMYKDKGIKHVFNRKQIEKLIERNAIIFTVAYYKDVPFVFHSYIYDEAVKTVRFYYSCSPFRQEKEISELIGRMNKGLHWFDFCEFKIRGVIIYDWGGIAHPENPDGIGKFKLGFGGEIVPKINIIKGVTFKGKAAVKAYDKFGEF